MLKSYLHVATLGKAHGIKGAISIISKTAPESLVFKLPLYLEHDEELIPFNITSFEEHHIKTVCTSDLIEDRTQAERMSGTKLYCLKETFFQSFPDQIYDDLCKGYRVLSKDNQLLGDVEYIHDIQKITMIRISGEHELNLPLKIESIDHNNTVIKLSYTP